MKAGLPCLETARLRLRPCRRDDIDVLHHIWTDLGVRKYVWDDQIIARSQAAEIIVHLWSAEPYQLEWRREKI